MVIFFIFLLRTFFLVKMLSMSTHAFNVHTQASRPTKIVDVKLYIFSYPSVKTNDLGAQKNHLIKRVLLSTHNICFCWEIRKLVIDYTPLSGGLAHTTNDFVYGFVCSDVSVYFGNTIDLYGILVTAYKRRSGKKVDIWGKSKIALLSGLPVQLYLWMDAPFLARSEIASPTLSVASCSKLC